MNLNDVGQCQAARTHEELARPWSTRTRGLGMLEDRVLEDGLLEQGVMEEG